MSTPDVKAAAARWVDDHGECLYRYALVRVRKPEVAEDLVVIHRTEFWQVMRDCLTKLPQKVRDVFTMREMDDVPSKEICAILSITDSNLWVMLHRARMALRECLEMNWFDKPAGGRA